MNTTVVALYARVSTEQQAQAQTIDSQLAALRERIASDGMQLLPQHEFIDSGHSGTTLLRPALERLRDAVATGEIERLYVHSPDRLARRYAYQVMLVDECQRAGVTLVFLNRALGQSPEDELLLQVQGMIAEYERAKKAQAVRRIFDWAGHERLSLGDVCRRLAADGIASPTGKTLWNRATVRGILNNTAYCGQAIYGRTHVGDPRPRQSAWRGRTLSTLIVRPACSVPASEWFSIPVPALVDEALFESAQAQLQENRRRLRSRQRPATRLLQGLLVCGCCGYSYCGMTTGRSDPYEYSCYRCIGNHNARLSGKERLCWNKPIRSDELEAVVWDQVCRLLQDPRRLANEYQRRLDVVQSPPAIADVSLLEQQITRVQSGIARLIDGYAEGYLEKSETEPRIRHFKERLQALQAQAEQARTLARQETDLQLVIGRLEAFSACVSAGLETLDWNGRRELIRTLVKRVEIGTESVRVVFRIGENPPPPTSGSSLHGCCPRKPALRARSAAPSRVEQVRAGGCGRIDQAGRIREVAAVARACSRLPGATGGGPGRVQWNAASPGCRTRRLPAEKQGSPGPLRAAASPRSADLHERGRVGGRIGRRRPLQEEPQNALDAQGGQRAAAHPRGRPQRRARQRAPAASLDPTQTGERQQMVLRVGSVNEVVPPPKLATLSYFR
jgi:site-specific DNA recombinase